MNVYHLRLIMKSDFLKTKQPHRKGNDMSKEKLNAANLKNALWETLQSVKDGKMEPGQADAVASQAREILRTTNTQLRICQQSKRSVPAEVLTFSESS